MPDSFRARDYVKANADLNGIKEEWEAVLHFLNHGSREGRTWESRLDPKFYAKLYLPPCSVASPEDLHQHWRQTAGDHFANLEEVLWSVGFPTSDWLVGIDWQSYIIVDSLHDRLANDVQASVHFLTQGIPDLLPLSAATRFDPAFYDSYKGFASESPAPALYREWLLTGRRAGEAPNEVVFLRGFDCQLASVPPDFDWKEYLAQHPNAAPQASDKWRAFRHFMVHGLVEGSSVPTELGTAVTLIKDVADRCAREGRLDAADKLYEQALLINEAHPALLQHGADLALRAGRAGRALRYYRQIRKCPSRNSLSHLNRL